MCAVIVILISLHAGAVVPFIICRAGIPGLIAGQFSRTLNPFDIALGYAVPYGA